MEKPIVRSRLRRFLGKEFYILKRKLMLHTSKKKWAKVNTSISFDYEVFSHKSLIIRPLKGVDMYLQHNKRKNLELAIKEVNGVVLTSSEVFSFWKLVGRPTKNKGYLEGLVLNQGNVSKGIGGGLCQLGNLLFWIICHSPLDVIERYRHSFDVFPDLDRKIPFGAGATLSYNYIDLQFRNNTENSFQIKLWLEDDYLYGALFSQIEVKSSFKVLEKNHKIKLENWGGYTRHNQIYKQEYLGGKNINECLLVENHAFMMYDPLIH